MVLGACTTSVVLAACGTRGGTLPEPEPCEPLNQSADASGQSSLDAYVGAVLEAETRLYAPTNEFLGKWPARQFSRRQEFREDLAATADRAACLAFQLESLSAPDVGYQEFDRVLDAAMAGYQEDMQIGRDAAEQRNVSKFRDWLAAVDALPGLLQTADLARPGR